MSKKMIWGVATLIILIGVSVFMLLRNTNTETDVVYTGRDPTETPQTAVPEDKPPDEPGYEWVRYGNHWDKVPISEEFSVENTKYATEEEGYSKEGVFYPTHEPRDPDRFAHLPRPPLPPSAVPEDCPEHLRLPHEWIDGVYRNIEPNPPEDQLTPEIGIKLYEIIQEIVREHNPNRHYAEIWDQFIEYEKMYIKYAEYELGYTPSSEVPGANRIDWMYEQTWAFPELIALGLPTAPSPPHGEVHPLLTARKVAIGYLPPDWNKITLKDGRDFFIKGKTRYEFVYSGVTEAGDEWENVSGFSRTPVTESTPVVRIDVMNTSDAELVDLMGWNYAINPITMQPLRYDGYYERIYPRSVTGE